MMRLLLLTLLTLVSTHAAIVGGLRVNTDTTGTNTTSVRVTVSGQTNLNAGVVNATNSVNAGVTGQAGLVRLGSTTSSNYVTFTTTSSNMFTIVNTTDAYDHAAFNFVVTNEITQADLLHIYNGTNVQVYIQYDGSILGGRLFAEDTPGGNNYVRIQPNDVKVAAPGFTGDNIILLDVAAGTITMVHESTNTFFVAQDSGYLGGGTRMFQDNGTFPANPRYEHATLSAASAATNYIADFAVAPYQTITAADDVYFLQSTNRAAVYSLIVFIDPNGSDRAFDVNASWKKLSPFYTTITNGTIGVLSLTVKGTAETDVYATYTVTQ